MAGQPKGAEIVNNYSAPPSGTSVYGGSGQSLSAKSYTKSRHPWILPNYKSLIADGHSLPSMYYFTSTERFTQTFGWNSDGDKFIAPIAGHGLIMPSSEAGNLLSDLDDKALSSLYANVKSADNFDLGVSLAEAHKTVSLVVSTAQRFGGAFRALRKGNFTGAFKALGVNGNSRIRGLPKRYINVNDHARHLGRRFAQRRNSAYDFAANTWLEIQYGWKPLMGEVYGAATQAGTTSQSRNDDLYVRSYSKGEFSDSSDKTVGVENVRRSYSGSIEIAYNMQLSVLHPTIRALASLGLTNPLNVIWEIVPFSFVIDWFAPVQDYISSLSAFHGYGIGDACRSVKRSESYSTNVFNIPGVYTPAFMEGEAERFERTVGISVVGSPPKPLFDLGAKLGATRLTSALSLARKTFLR